MAERNGNGKGALVKQTRDLLFARRAEFAEALAGRVDPEVFLRVAHQAITRNPALLQGTKESLLMALSEAASLGLLPTGVMGEAYLIPRRNKKTGKVEVQFQPGYRGLVTLCRRSGGVKNIIPGTIYEGDTYAIEMGTDRRLHHIPTLDPAQRGAPIIYYAIARMPDGSTEFWYKTRAAVEQIRARSTSADDGPWKTDYEPMAWKTVIREFVKYLPMSSHEVAAALEADNREYDARPDNRAVDALNRALDDTDDRPPAVEAEWESDDLGLDVPAATAQSEGR